MSQDDEAAKKSRAEKLRAQISKLKKEDKPEEEESDTSKEGESQPHRGKSPRDFINERMRELDEDEE